MHGTAHMLWYPKDRDLGFRVCGLCGLGIREIGVYIFGGPSKG